MQKSVDMVIFENMVDLMSKGDIAKEYRKLAKRANQRIVELAKHNIDIPLGEGKSMLEMQGRNRFREYMSKKWLEETNLNTLRKELKVINRFLESKQTTISGRKEIKNQVHEQFQNYGVMLEGKAMDTFISEFSKLKDRVKYSYREALEIFSAYTIEKENLTEKQILHAMNMLAYSPNPEIARKRLIKASHATKSEFETQMRLTRDEIIRGTIETQHKRHLKAQAVKRSRNKKNKKR